LATSSLHGLIESSIKKYSVIKLSHYGFNSIKDNKQ